MKFVLTNDILDKILTRERKTEGWLEESFPSKEKADLSNLLEKFNNNMLKNEV